MFLVKFQEFERCHNDLSNYSLIHASSAIRPLLFDSNPLIDILNREKMLPIKFCVNNMQFFSETEIENSLFLWKEISPILYESYLHLKKDGFLKHPCVYYLSKPITVLDVLKFYAYVRGGIHLDRGQKEYEPLREAFELIKVNQISSLDHTMRGIIEVIYGTLSQFKEQLLN